MTACLAAARRVWPPASLLFMDPDRSRTRSILAGSGVPGAAGEALAVAAGDRSAPSSSKETAASTRRRRGLGYMKV
ncbi:hypothetical protein BN2537_853 [Streptomyces venezuelae]|nr:hypothetical protein BN2537_853 [Streptomyces venezuelae]